MHSRKQSGALNPSLKITVEKNNGLGNAKKILSTEPKAFGTPYRQLSTKQLKKYREKINNRTITQEEYKRYSWNKRFKERRDEGVKAFWQKEIDAIQKGDAGKRNYLPEQLAEMEAGNIPTFGGKKLAGHHKYSASEYPQLANDPNNIYPATFREHFERWHGGRWANQSRGVPLRPEYMEEF